MRFLKLTAVTAAYLAILLFLPLSPDFVLGASLAPVVLVFWGRQIYAYLSTSDKYIDFQAGALLCILIVVPFVVAGSVAEILTITPQFSGTAPEATAYAITIVFEWLVYVLIWSGDMIVNRFKILRRRQQAAKLEARETEAAERRAHQLAEQEKERQAAQRTRQQNDLVRLQHEHEGEFYRLREETLELFLKHHALLKDEVTIASITKEYQERQASIHDSWDDFLQFNKRWQFRVLVGAARNNLLTDYARAQAAIGDVFPRDQFWPLVKDAIRRDANTYDSDACIERLVSLHDKIVQLFHDRSSEWQSKCDANKAEAYDAAFAEIDDEPKGQSPFDDDDRVTYQHDVG